MTQPTSPSDRSDGLNRRDLLRLGAASAGLPLTVASTYAGPREQPAQADPNATPVTDTPQLPREDHPEARARTIDNLMRIGLAMQSLAAANQGRFPSAAIRKDGKPLLSWRVALLPFLDMHFGARLYRKFHLDEPWHSAHNKALLEEMPPEYEAVVHKDRAPQCTYYQVLFGPGTLFDGDEGTRIADVTDGVGWTVMVVEAAEPVPWTKPEDVPYDMTMPVPKLGGQFEDGFYVAFADGSARFLSRKVAPDTLRALIMRGDSEVITFDKLGPWRRPVAKHR
jgi:hypothetical protein